MSSSFSFLPATNPSASVSSPTSVFYPVSLCLTVSSCPNLYFPISLFLCFSLFYSECHQTQEIKNANAKLELHLHAFSCCFGIWNLFVLFFIFPFNTSNPLFDQHTAFVFRQSCNVLVHVRPKQHTLITSFQEHDKVRFFTTMTMTMGPNLGLLNQSKALLKARQTPELRAFA